MALSTLVRMRYEMPFCCLNLAGYQATKLAVVFQRHNCLKQFGAVAARYGGRAGTRMLAGCLKDSLANLRSDFCTMPVADKVMNLNPAGGALRLVPSR